MWSISPKVKQHKWEKLKSYKGWRSREARRAALGHLFTVDFFLALKRLKDIIFKL